MDYSQIIHRSWEIIKNKRFLWALGLLAIFTEGSFGIIVNFPIQMLNAYTTSSSTRPQSPQDVAMSALKYDPLSWIGSHGTVLVTIFLLVILIVVAILYYSYAAKAALILSVANNEVQKPITEGFVKSVSTGKPFVWRLWGMSLVLQLSLFICLGALAGVLIYGGYRAYQGSISNVALGALVLAGILYSLIALVVLVYSQIVLRISGRILVLKNMRIISSLREALSLVRSELGKTFITWLVSVGIGIACSFIYIFGVFVAMILLSLIGIGVYELLKFVGVVVYALIVSIVVIFALFILRGIYTAFLSSYWTISYRALEYIAEKGE